MSNNTLTVDDSAPRLIKGGRFEDNRGLLEYNNNWTPDKAKRFYFITPKNLNTIRAWQGHKMDTKWFMVISGKMEIKAIKVDNWSSPSTDLPVLSYELNSESNSILEIPGGYVNGFRSLVENSTLLVFSKLDLEDAKSDDYRFDKEKWNVW